MLGLRQGNDIVAVCDRAIFNSVSKNQNQSEQR